MTQKLSHIRECVSITSSCIYAALHALLSRNLKPPKLYSDILRKLAPPKIPSPKWYHPFTLQLIGDAAIAQVVTSNGAAGGFLTVNIGYGIGLIVALYVSIGVSGGHLNPAVTLAMALRGKLCWLKVSTILVLHV